LPELYIPSGKELENELSREDDERDDVGEKMLGSLEVSSFLLALETYFASSTDSTGAPIAALQLASTKAKTLGQSMQNIVKGKNLLSKQVKTI
jgi:hypothetical protein